MAAFMLCFIPVAAFAEETVPAVSDPQTAPCKGLKPYNNLDELLYQFYINLDSDCLFKMPIEDLEKTWDTKIFVPVDLEGHLNINYDKSDFMEKPYKIERDGFYIMVTREGKPGFNRFWIRMTSDYAKEKSGLYSYCELPKMFQQPHARGTTYYSWYNLDKTREMLFGTSDPNIDHGKVGYILICNDVIHP